MDKINKYDEFLIFIKKAGFVAAGGSSPFSLNSCFGEEIEYHTEKTDTDPWEWRSRVLNEQHDILYGKVFFGQTGYIIKQWIPYFAAVRRPYELYEAYESGVLNPFTKKIYEVLLENKTVPAHDLKKMCGVTKETNSKYERAIVEMQMRLYITLDGFSRKISQKGEAYGWNANTFTLLENRFGDEILEEAKRISLENAKSIITEQILTIWNKTNDDKMIIKLIGSVK